MLKYLNENIYFDIGINYTKSDRNSFADMSSIMAIDDVVHYEIVDSKSNSIGLHLGFHFVFGCNSKWKNVEENNTSQSSSSTKNSKRKPRAKRKKQTNNTNNQKN